MQEAADPRIVAAAPTVHVVGGTYLERCRESRWDELFGSGLRAAVAIRQLGPQSVLSTYISDVQRGTLYASADAAGVTLAATSVRDTLRFTYAHGLARPVIDPSLHLLEHGAPLQVEGDVILRFGMLDGDAVVHGRAVVYDPQSTYDPRPFGENGSTADRLAVVANRGEAERLSGMMSPEAAGRALLTQGAEVVVVKQGAAGLLVCARTNPGATVREEVEVVRVPAFRTPAVFPIGSGDVFSAAFTVAWAVRGFAPAAAAMFASRAAAAYCAAPRVPLPVDAHPGSDLRPIRPTAGGRQPRRVYLAGPFFTTAERWLVEEAYATLSHQGVAVFSPFHDVGVGPAHLVAPADLRGLEETDAVFAIVDGFDAGTLFEVGYARSHGIPVVAFVQNEPAEPLKMLVGTDCELVDDFASALYHAAWAAQERGVGAEPVTASAPEADA
jgi:nucleoside 2-deoxyribosyltransferase